MPGRRSGPPGAIGGAPRQRSGHPRIRYPLRRLLAQAVLVLLVALGVARPAAAAEFIQGDAPRVRALTQVNEDVYLFGDAAEVNGTANRDVVAAANTFDLTSNGSIGGNLMVAAREASIGGNVGRSARLAAQRVTITGNVRIQGDVLVAAQEVVIGEGVRIGGDLIATGDIEVRGEVGGDVRASGGEILIDAPVGGDASLASGEVRLGPAARIAGDLTYESAEAAVVDPAARVAGVTERRDRNSIDLGDGVGAFGGVGALTGGVVGAVIRLLCALIAGLVVVLITPRAAVAVADGARRRLLPSFFIGLAMLVFLPILLALFLVTVVGAPIALVGFALFFVALYLSQVFVGLAIGRFILPRSWGDTGRGFNLLAMALGVILLAAVRLIPAPYLSGVVALLTGIIGLGAVVVGSRRARAVPAASPAGYPYAPGTY
jgi:cytoskeletal protein CcmA (bactofilin family)